MGNDLMAIRRRLMQMAGSGISFPSNVEVKTVILENESGSNNMTIPNPFGRTNITNLVGINFGVTEKSKTMLFTANPGSDESGHVYSRKAVINSSDRIEVTNYFAIVSMTDAEIVLRSNGTYNYVKGTYYLFAW